MATGPQFGRRRDPKLPHRTFPVRSKAPRGLAKALSPDNPPASGPMAVKPSNWPGSDPEWVVFWALTKVGKRPNIDFTYQSARMGGRLMLGGAVVDFLVQPDLAINVQGEFFHYEAGAGKVAFDRTQARNLEARGIRMVFIDAKPLMSDATGRAAIELVQDALKGIDRSQETNGLI